MPHKIGALLCSVKFLFPEVVLYLYKPTMQPCIEYCCYVWAGTPSCYLDMLDKLLKWVCRTVCPTFPVSAEPSAHCGNVASSSFFYRMSI